MARLAHGNHRAANACRGPAADAGGGQRAAAFGDGRRFMGSARGGDGQRKAPASTRGASIRAEAIAGLIAS
ncbi:MAG: hypothetical protein KGN16_24375 [Burkholderiales bacterium]|nr:hypothetical protein [Burkholderiales bacterium]